MVFSRSQEWEGESGLRERYEQRPRGGNLGGTHSPSLTSCYERGPERGPRHAFIRVTDLVVFTAKCQGRTRNKSHLGSGSIGDRGTELCVALVGYQLWVRDSVQAGPSCDDNGSDV